MYLGIFSESVDYTQRFFLTMSEQSHQQYILIMYHNYNNINVYLSFLNCEIKFNFYLIFGFESPHPLPTHSPPITVNAPLRVIIVIILRISSLHLANKTYYSYTVLKSHFKVKPA